jgi:hypothetical protein
MSDYQDHFHDQRAEATAIKGETELDRYEAEERKS